MNIKDYAKDVNLSVAEVLRKCSELGIKADGNSTLSDDDIIMIDNTINLISTDKETTYEEEDQIDDVVEKVLQSENIVKKDMVANSKQKLKKKDSSNADFKNLKKQMYKNKSKLMSNVKEDNIVLYEEGMSVKGSVSWSINKCNFMTIFFSLICTNCLCNTSSFTFGYSSGSNVI